jgi:hypothetical protein
MALGGIFTLLASEIKDTPTTYMEATETHVQVLTNQMTDDVYEGFFLKIGDIIPYVTFQFKCPNPHPPLGYPFTYIKTIEILVGGQIIAHYTGKQLWCMIQTLHDEKRRSALLAAQKGIVILKDFMPALSIASLVYHETKWKITTNQQVYERLLSSFRSSQSQMIADLVLNGIGDLGHLACLYAGTERGSITNYTPFVFLNTELRDKLIREDHSLLYPMYNYQEWPVSQCTNSIHIECTFRRVLQFNFIVERGDEPNTFYTPEDDPIEEIILDSNGVNMFRGSRNELYIIDKFVHNLPIPTHVAHYTHTYQSFEEFSKGEGSLSNFNEIPIKGRSCLNMSKMNFSVKVKISPHVDPNAKVCMWIMCASALRYYNGVGINQN